ncbi:NAD-dependent epimerase/dehydratase family protein [Nocardioides dilutus]
MTTLLVGRGLLGRAVSRRLERQGQTPHAVSVTWADRDRALRELIQASSLCADEGDEDGWRLAWCAGAGVVNTPEEELLEEVSLLEAFLAALARPPRSMFLASSAGGVYAGSDQPPFTERHAPCPVSAYGRAKLAAEAAGARLAVSRGTRVAIGRLANLYGPDQALRKRQGLLSQLCLGRVTGQPVHLYVSTDTLRDYLYVDDAAAVAVAMLDRVGLEVESTVVIKIVASGRAATISEVVGASTKAFRRRVPLVRAVIDDSGQVRDLRLRSEVWTDLDSLVRTPLVVGLRATAEGVAAEHRSGRLDAALPR